MVHLPVKDRRQQIRSLRKRKEALSGGARLNLRQRPN
jgi:hypothetical protein